MKIERKIISLLLAITLITASLVIIPTENVHATTMAASFAVGNGTQENPFLISTADEFELMRLGDMASIAGIDSGNVYFTLTNDIYYDSAYEITESGSYEAGGLYCYFINGNGYSVHNITISGHALFDSLYNSKISNISFNNCQIKNAPLLAYSLYGCTVSNVSLLNSNVSLNSKAYDSYYGYGALADNFSDTDVDHINVDIDMSFKGSGEVGMICGVTDGDMDSCKASGSLTINSSGDIWAGCICGKCLGNITDSVNDANISASLPNKDITSYIAGVVGSCGNYASYDENTKKTKDMPSKISDCTNNGKITVSTKWCKHIYIKKYKLTSYTNQNTYVGGIVSEADAGSTITNCSNSGKISAKFAFSVAGIGAYLEASLKNCKNTGNITGTYTCVAAGIAGCVEGNVSHCENAGAIKVDNKKRYLSNNSRSAGIVGDFLSSKSSNSIKNCKNLGTISQSDAKYNYSSSAGIVFSISQNDKYHSTVSGCYNTGVIKGGAIAGIVYCSGNYGKNKTKNVIKSCVNAGQLYEIYNDDRAGGINGWSQNTKISSCYNMGTIKRKYTKYSDLFAQIACGNNDYNRISNCYILSKSQCKWPATGINQNGGKITGTKRISKAKMKRLAAVKKIIANAGVE